MGPRLPVSAGTLLLLLLAGCAINPATGKRQISLVSEAREVEMGREAHQQITQSMDPYPDQELQDYISRLGLQLAAVAERPDLPWTFTVIDDPSVNAFALPGGFIYITRGILTHAVNEAQIAAILGHEIGHVTGRHSVEQISKAQLANVGLLAGMILAPELQQFGRLAQTGLGLLFLKFGRDDEREADDLSLRYMSRTNYKVDEAAEVFRMLDSVTQVEQGGRLPEWLATHPSPGNRMQRIREQVADIPVATAEGELHRERFLAHLDAIVFGENPREGYFVGNAFYHPEMEFRLQLPEGWKTVNQKQVVGAVSPQNDAAMILTLAPGSSAQAAARTFFTQSGARAGNMSPQTINGLPAISASFAGQTQGGTVYGVLSFVEYRDRVFQLLGYTSAQRFNSYQGALVQAVTSFAPLLDRRYIDVEPKRLDIVRIAERMTIDEFQRSYPSSVDREVLLRINQLEEDDVLLPDRSYKRVIGGEFPGS